MRESKRSHHKKRKWICPQCGGARMQNPKPDRRTTRGKQAHD